MMKSFRSIWNIAMRSFGLVAFILMLASFYFTELNSSTIRKLLLCLFILVFINAIIAHFLFGRERIKSWNEMRVKTAILVGIDCLYVPIMVLIMLPYEKYHEHYLLYIIEMMAVCIISAFVAYSIKEIIIKSTLKKINRNLDENGKNE